MRDSQFMIMERTRYGQEDETDLPDYQEFKEDLDNAIGAAVEDFVLIGFYLNMAKKKPALLEGSGYENIKQMAYGEYGLDESQVSRFIAINERYGDGPELLPQYRGYGQSKLSEMLSLPAAVADELPPTVTRAQIREIKEDIREGKQITDLELYVERTQNPIESIWLAFFGEWALKNPQDFLKLEYPELYESLRGHVLTARVPGEGKFALTEDGEHFTLTSLRDSSKYHVPIEYFTDAIIRAVQGEDPVPFPFCKEKWEELTNQPFPEEEIAPAQEEKKAEKKKETKAPSDKASKRAHEETKKGKNDKIDTKNDKNGTKNVDLGEKMPETALETTEPDTPPDSEHKPLYENLGTSSGQAAVEDVEATVEDIPEDEIEHRPSEYDQAAVEKVELRLEYIRRSLDRMKEGNVANEWDHIYDFASIIRDLAKDQYEELTDEEIEDDR